MARGRIRLGACSRPLWSGCCVASGASWLLLLFFPFVSLNKATRNLPYTFPISPLGRSCFSALVFLSFPLYLFAHVAHSSFWAFSEICFFATFFFVTFSLFSIGALTLYLLRSLRIRSYFLGAPFFSIYYFVFPNNKFASLKSLAARRRYSGPALNPLAFVLPNTNNVSDNSKSRIDCLTLKNFWKLLSYLNKLTA